MKGIFVNWDEGSVYFKLLLFAVQYTRYFEILKEKEQNMHKASLNKTFHSFLLPSFVVRMVAHGVMGRRIDPSWGGPIELFLIPASAPRLV